VTAALESLLAAGVADGTFTAAQASVWLDGARVFQGGAGKAEVDTPFDLASLTKALCTTACFVGLWAEGRLEPTTPVARAFPGTPLADAGVTATELLAHRSGLPAFVPFFAEVMRGTPELLQLGCPPELRRTTRLRVRELALRTPLVAAPPRQSVYSDPGFIVLGELLAECGAEPLDALQARFVTGRFGLPLHFHKLSARGRDMRDPCAGDWDRLPPTGSERPRPPAPGQTNDWRTVPPSPSAPGEVDDDNAWVLDGVAGHAGLFGTADDVARFGQRVLEELDGAGRLAPPSHWAWAVMPDPSVRGSTRAFGFDTPSATDSSAGRLLGNKPPGAFGHLGFTGTSLWVDRARRLSLALLTNRTRDGRDNRRIQEFRPRFHDAVVESLGLA
jgi:CubicO group peptidase (beta-lactamase class C family)